MDEDLKKLNPSVNYNVDTSKKINLMALDDRKNKLNAESKEWFEKRNTDNTFYKLFGILMMFVFIIIILNISFASYKMLVPDALSPCKIQVGEIKDVYCGVHDSKSAQMALLTVYPGEYTFIEYKFEPCGYNGIFAYYFKDMNTTYIVCDDTTVSRLETVCIRQGPIQKMFISMVTLFN